MSFSLFLSRCLPALALVFAGAAQAGIVFTPHLSEYGPLPRGSYADHTYIYTQIDEIFDRNRQRKPLGETAIPPGSTVDAQLLLFRSATSRQPS